MRSLRICVISGVLLLAFAPATSALAQASGTWAATGSMTTTSANGSPATLLHNGQVLLAGAAGAGSTSADLYTPATGTWAATGSMTTARSYARFSATLLHNGEVLLTGGENASFEALASADLYNPATGTFSPTGSMTTARQGATATLLPNGEVLVAGGFDNTGTYLSSAELYNPATGTWILTGSMTTARQGAAATLLQNGEVLVAGGGNSTLLSSSELYNPATGKWTTTGSGPAGSSKDVLLPNGDVLALTTGGITELYNPAAGSWSTSARFADIGAFSVTLLDTGKVLLAGGLTYSPRPTHSVASASLYDPATGTWQATGTMTTPRDNQNAVLLQSGRVLVAGGVDIGTPSKGLTSAEVYQP
jgi:N-acetylneuraminic acid mutarotase